MFEFSCSLLPAPLNPRSQLGAHVRSRLRVLTRTSSGVATMVKDRGDGEMMARIMEPAWKYATNCAEAH